MRVRAALATTRRRIPLIRAIRVGSMRKRSMCVCVCVREKVSERVSE